MRNRALIHAPAFDVFIETYALKAAECLKKDCEALLALYDFHAEHWKHLKPINLKSTFATVQHMTIRKGGFLVPEAPDALRHLRANIGGLACGRGAEPHEAAKRLGIHRRTVGIIVGFSRTTNGSPMNRESNANIHR
jgi:hypothetical protein